MSSSTDNDKTDVGYIKTASHNYVSRKATVQDPQKVELKGKSVVKDGVVIRGDLGQRIQMGRYVTVEQDSCLTPCDAPMVIRGHVTIGKACEIQAASIGSYVRIGNDVKIGKRCLIKDVCILEEGVQLEVENDHRPSKRSRIEHNGGALPANTSDLMSQVEELAGVFSATLDL